MFSGLLIILVPLIVGYLIPLRQQAALKVINQLLSWMVYLILFFMGIRLMRLPTILEPARIIWLERPCRGLPEERHGPWAARHPGQDRARWH